MRVRTNHHASRRDVTVLHHHLMADTGSRTIEVDTMLIGEGFDLGVLPKIFRRVILNVMINGVDRLPGIMDFRCTNRLELAHDRRRIVMRHDVLGPDPYEIARIDASPIGKTNGMAGCNLLNERGW